MKRMKWTNLIDVKMSEYKRFAIALTVLLVLFLMFCGWTALPTLKK